MRERSKRGSRAASYFPCGITSASWTLQKGRGAAVDTSYVYGAHEEQTAVSEVRPHRSTLMTIRAGETLRELRLPDLAAGMHIPSPFECS
jgi:hypothetical protein